MRTEPDNTEPSRAGVQEIEVKYRVPDAAAVVRALAGRGVTMSAPVRQDDQAYAPIGWTYGQSKIGVPFARLRTENDRHLFTVKTPIDNAMACAEHESEIVDRPAMHRAIIAMGFYPTVKIVKTRRTARLGDMGLCLDDVEQVGVFLEVEQLVAVDASGKAAQRQLDEFVRSLGVDGERTCDTYDTHVYAAAETGRAR